MRSCERDLVFRLRKFRVLSYLCNFTVKVGIDVASSPTRMEQGQNFQQPPVPPSTPSSSSFFLLDAACVPRRSRVKPFSPQTKRTNGLVQDKGQKHSTA